MTVCGLAFDSLSPSPRSPAVTAVVQPRRPARSLEGGGGSSRVSRVTGPVLSFASRSDRGTDAGVTAVDVPAMRSAASAGPQRDGSQFAVTPLKGDA